MRRARCVWRRCPASREAAQRKLKSLFYFVPTFVAVGIINNLRFRFASLASLPLLRRVSQARQIVVVSVVVDKVGKL